MLRCPSLALVLAVLTAALTLSSSAFGQQSTRKDFEEFSKQMSGRWIGKVVWVADWPEVGGKKGDEVTVPFHVQAEADGHLLVGKHYGGDGYAAWLVWFDPGSSTIQGQVVTSAGGSIRLTYYKKSGKWKETGEGALPDGTKTTTACGGPFRRGSRPLGRECEGHMNRPILR